MPFPGRKMFGMCNINTMLDLRLPLVGQEKLRLK